MSVMFHLTYAMAKGFVQTTNSLRYLKGLLASGPALIFVVNKVSDGVDIWMQDKAFWCRGAISGVTR